MRAALAVEDRLVDALSVIRVVTLLNAVAPNLSRPDNLDHPLARALAVALGSLIRDEGPGIAEGRLEEAAEQGRLGVRESIRGRIRDLGGESSPTRPPAPSAPNGSS